MKKLNCTSFFDEIGSNYVIVKKQQTLSISFLTTRTFPTNGIKRKINSMSFEYVEINVIY